MNVAEIAQQLVSIPSVNPGSMAAAPDALHPDGGGEAALALWIEQFLRKIGARTHTWEPLPGRPCVTGWFDFGASETLIFDAHLDTVPVEGMTVEPFAGTIKNGRLYGRGACDIKGPAASLLYALSEIAREFFSAPPGDSQRRPRFNALYAAVCDEESGFSGVQSFSRLITPIWPPNLAGIVVVEPTLLNPIYAHKGVVRWEIATRGKAGHSSAPQSGINAIYAMGRVVQRLEDYARQLLERPAHQALGVPTLSVGTIHGGSAVNIIPDHCAIQVDRRLVPGETPEEALQQVRELFAAELAAGHLEITSTLVAAPPMEGQPNSRLVQLTLDAARSAGHQTPQAQVASYCTDASFYGAAPCDCVVFGPGSIEQAHTKDEYIALEHLEAGVSAYRSLIIGG